MPRASLVALTAALLLAPARYDRDGLPYHAAWGPYRVVAEKSEGGDEAGQRVRVLDAAGRVQREIRDASILDVAFPELTGRGTPELYVHGYSGGAHCCSTEYYFTLEGGLRNLMIFQGDNGGILEVKDLDGNGRPEIIASSDALAYFGGITYAQSPRVAMVIGWDGTRYTDQTRRFPQRARRRAREYRAAFLAALRQRDEFAEESRRGAAAGYYGNALIAGEGAAARRWLLQRAPAPTHRWLRAEEAHLRAAVAESGGKIRVSQDRVLEGPSITSTAH